MTAPRHNTIRGTSIGKTPRQPYTVNSAPTAWMEDAMCAQPGVDPDLWFPWSNDEPHGVSVERLAGRQRHAAELCAGCPVADVCRDYAIKNKLTEGVYGGLTPLWREKYAKRVKHELAELAAGQTEMEMGEMPA